MAEVLEQDDEDFMYNQMRPFSTGPVAQITVRMPGPRGDVTEMLVPVNAQGFPFADVAGLPFVRTVSGDLIALSAVVRIEGLDEAQKAADVGQEIPQGGPPPLTREISDAITRSFTAATIPSEMARGLIERGVFAPPVADDAT